MRTLKSNLEIGISCLKTYGNAYVEIQSYLQNEHEINKTHPLNHLTKFHDEFCCLLLVIRNTETVPVFISI